MALGKATRLYTVTRTISAIVCVALLLSSAVASARVASVGCSSSVLPGIPPPSRVPSGIPGFHASWFGQSGYMRLCPGETGAAVVAFYNSGSRGWVQGRMGEAAYLGTWQAEPGQDQPSVVGGDGQLGSPNTGWPRFDRVAVQPSFYVGPGQIAWFQFRVRAPATPGTYRLGIRPVIEGATWLEDYGVFWEIAVLNPDGSDPPRTPADPAGMYYRIDRGVLAQDIHDVHEGVAREGRYLGAFVGGDRTGRADAHVYTGDGTQRYCCITTGAAFEIVTHNSEWLSPGAVAPDTWPATTERKELAAHEYVHVWQHEIGGNACMLGPRWISEGMAESLAYRALENDGLVSEAALDTFVRRQLQNGAPIALRSLESSWPADTNPFAVAYLAVDRLLASAGPLRLRSWCARVGAGADWRSAFAATFGETTDAFYARFEAFRADYQR